MQSRLPGCNAEWTPGTMAVRRDKGCNAGSVSLNHCPLKESHTDCSLLGRSHETDVWSFPCVFCSSIKENCLCMRANFYNSTSSKEQNSGDFCLLWFYCLHTWEGNKKSSQEFKAWLCKYLPKQKTKGDKGGTDRVSWNGSSSNPDMDTALLSTPEPASCPVWPACPLSIELRFSFETITTAQTWSQGPRVLPTQSLWSLPRSKTFHPQWAGSGS